MRRLYNIALCLLLIASIVTPACAVNAVPNPVIKATASVVRVLAEYSDGYATGSGFVIKSDKAETLIATNHHVVEGNPHSISVWINQEETLTATILAYSSQKDMCILKLAYPISVKPLPFAKNSAIQGDAVYAVGFPSVADYLSDKEAHTSADATITDGIISAVREATISTYGTPTKILQINAAINSGNSGGPLFNAKGEIIGINTYGMEDSQGIFGAIDASELTTFMADNQITISSPRSNFPWKLIVAISGIGLLIVLISRVSAKRLKSSQRKKANTIPLMKYMAAYPEGIGVNNAVAMLLPVALQLRDMHNNGSAHLEISPNSIVVCENSAILAEPTLIESNRYISGYAAPEIYRGISSGSAADIYSFCAVLSYVASGIQPTNALSRTETDINNLASQEDSTFVEIITTAMEIDSTRRYASMQDIIVRLSAYNTQPFTYLEVTEERSIPQSAPVKTHIHISKKVATIVPIVLIITLLGTYIGCFFGAKNNAINEDFKTAKKLLFLPQIAKMHSPDLLSYIDAGLLMEERNYSESLTAFIRLSDYMNSEILAKESSYRLALQDADKGEFSKAERRMGSLAKEGYKDSKEKVQEIQHRWAWSLIEEEDYVTAYLKLTAIPNYSDVNETIPALMELMYLKGQLLYYEEEYSDAAELFKYTADYKDSQKYITLIKAHTYILSSHAETLAKSLLDIFYFEDASNLLLSDHHLAKHFLCGTWKGDGYYFTMKEDSRISCNLPLMVYGDYYRIEDGGMLFYPKEDFYNTKEVFRFFALTPDCIEVFCFKNSKTYTLYRS